MERVTLGPMTGDVVAVHRSPGHGFSKETVDEIRLLAGLGVEGDAHCGATVKHRSRVRVDPTQPNLRQVHLVQGELFAQVAAAGYVVTPGDLGENVTTSGIDLLALPTGATLGIGPDALIALTGLRNPCGQIDGFAAGLRDQVLERDGDGGVVRKAGVMGVVLRSGAIRPGDAIAVALPPGSHHPLERV